MMRRIVLILGLALGLLVGPVNASSHPGVGLTSGTKTSSTSAATAAVTVAANQLALAWVVTGNGGQAPPTASDPSRTWTLVSTGTPGERRLSLFSSISPAQTTGALTLRNFASTGWGWTVVQFPATAVVQSKYDDYKTWGQQTHQAVLPNPGSGGYTAAAFAMFRDARPISPGAGYQFVGGQPCWLICLQAESRADFAQIATMDWANPASKTIHWLVIAVDLR